MFKANDFIHYSNYIHYFEADLVTTGALVGGVASQDIIRFISAGQSDISGWFVLGSNGDGNIVQI